MMPKNLAKVKGLLFSPLLFFYCSCGRPAYDLAYAVNRDRNYDIYLMKGDSTRTTRLTETPVTEYNFSWSPGGETLYYTSYEKPHRQIKSLDIRTLTVSVLMGDSTTGSLSDVSPDGSQFLLTTTEHHAKGELYLYTPATKSLKRLTHNDWYESGAKFSPDGSKAVTSIQTSRPDSINQSGNAELFLVDINTGTLTQLTRLEGFNALPDYSPNGRQIAFHRCITGNCDIYLINDDGTSPRNLTANTTDSRWPRWTPDGKWIVYTRSVKNNSDIYFISPKSGRIKPILISSSREEIAEVRPFPKKRSLKP